MTLTLTFHVVLFFTITTEIVAAFTRNHASLIPTRTASNQPQKSFHIQPRDTSTAVVNFDALASATCAFSLCVYPNVGTAYVSPPCTAVATPCPSVSAAAAGGTNCSTFPLECYCQQPIPLYCAWSCSWYQWFLAEDWFKTQCPNIPPIDFNSAPKCARKCLSEESINYGCVGSTRNCFCSHGSVFDCEKQCSQAVQNSLASWYADQCEVSLSEANKEIGVAGSKNVTATLFKLPEKLHWYEIVPVVTASISGAIFIGIIFMNGLFIGW
ncbi:uncharacterized protein PAC_19029 [Phialocephala subalpina]|uniref:Extracellular membrane protein CFEM domain-containing protein n=1 Tax=Phialocephala subalpina TaxID=576137 RepID=A0A1L7XVW4_9HELO|nr:uncharacterized protein PAC_19029 [Phialocephala subalpina]